MKARLGGLRQRPLERSKAKEVNRYPWNWFHSLAAGGGEINRFIMISYLSSLMKTCGHLTVNKARKY